MNTSPADGDSAERGSRLRSCLLPVVIWSVMGAAGWVLIVSQISEPFAVRDALTAAVIAAATIIYDVIARRIEYLRRLKRAGPYITMTSVWTFSAAISLPLRWSALIAILTVSLSELQNRLRGLKRPTYRVVFNASTIVISCAVASFIVRDKQALVGIWTSPFEFTIPLIIVSAIAAYAAVNSALVGLAIVLANGTLKPAEVLGNRSENVLELTTLTLGALLAVAIRADVWLCLLVAPAMALLQRSALVEQLESEVSEDGKTGLLNAAAWQHLAERDLARGAARQQAAALLIIDLDHFKQINDTHGHLSGDKVLRAVADCMKGMLRDRDLVARFGGEEFAAFLPGADAKEAMIVADRLRSRIEALRVAQVGDSQRPAATPRVLDVADGVRQIGVTVSIGVAAFPIHGVTINALIEKADAALYEAKDAGRNRVHISELKSA